MSDEYTNLRPLAEEMARLLEYGCSDHHCRLVKRPRGQGTNGGCKCIRGLSWLGQSLAAEADVVEGVCGSDPVFDKSALLPKPPTTGT